MIDNIVLRADAGGATGTGHMMRCLALAQAARRKNIGCTFVTANPSPIVDRIRDEGFTVREVQKEDDARQTIEIAKMEHAQWIVADGYAFDAAYQKTIRDAGLRLLVIDDYAHLKKYETDLLLNVNIGMEPSLYGGKSSATLLLGPRYALLREEFLKARAARDVRPAASRVLVTLGGASPAPLLTKIVDALEMLRSPLDIQLLTGSEGQTPTLPKTSHHTLIVERGVSDVAQRMQWADVAIAAAGGTSWELLSMGLPAITGILAENQERIAEELGRAKLAVNAGWYKNVSVEKLATMIEALLKDKAQREMMSKKGQSMVDGKGADRVIEAMLDFHS